MPRPRRQFSGQNVVTTSNDPLYQEYLPGSVGSRRRIRWNASKNLVYKTLNSFQDPMSLMLVVDALLRIDTSIELRAKYLVEYMDAHYNQIQWDHINLGKILAALADDMNDVLPNTSFLRPSRDENGWFYLLSVTPESIELLFRLRDDLQKLTLSRLQEPVGYRRAKLDRSPLFECPSLRGEWVDPNAGEE